jgi:hypothetical protein
MTREFPDFGKSVQANRRSAAAALIATCTSLLFLAGEAGSKPAPHVDCDRGQSLQALFSPAGRAKAPPLLLRPSAIVVVSGTCNENVEITEEFDGITLDGAGTAMINGPDSSSDTLRLIVNNGASGMGSGIRVDRTSQADIASNIIDLNRDDGVRVVQNAGVNLGTATSGHFLELVNSTGIPNSGVGIRGQIGGYAVGGLGALNGTAGQKNFTDASAIDRITP